MTQINDELARGELRVLLPDELLWSVVIPVTVGSFAVSLLIYAICCTFPQFTLQPLGLLVLSPPQPQQQPPPKEQPQEEDAQNNTNTTFTATTTATAITTNGPQTTNDTTKQPQQQQQQQQQQNEQQQQQAESLLEIRKAAYDVTNLCSILILSVGGAYLQVHVLGGWFPNHLADVSFRDKAIGFTMPSILALSSWQLGWQWWALPTGYWHVQESTSMLVHHVAVILSATMTSFCHVGFRYHTPYFYGIIEWSSVPLLLMNLFKQRPAWRRDHPHLYTFLRTFFSALFMPLRVVWFIPRHWDLIRLKYWNVVTHPFLVSRIFYTIVWTGGWLLLALQLFWATLIVKGFVTFFAAMYRNHQKKNKSQNTTTKHQNNNLTTTTNSTSIVNGQQDDHHNHSSSSSNINNNKKSN
ncbi:hypothetical protein ACA910_019481 [Epithemia clementina (nom. ined.)]